MMDQFASKVLVIPLQELSNSSLISLITSSIGTCVINFYVYITQIQNGHAKTYQNILVESYSLLSTIQPHNYLFSPFVILEPINPNFLNNFNANEIHYFNDFQSTRNQENQIQKIASYQHIAIGGTFDYLHSGHKLLISSALLYTSQSMIIGISGNKLLQNKKYPEWIQPFQLRAYYAQKFANLFDPTVEIITVEINDPAGPAAYEQRLQALILTQESLNGGLKTNEMRKQNNLQPLNIEIIDLVMQESNKQSSSFIRQYLSQKNDGNNPSFLIQNLKKLFNQSSIQTLIWTNTISLMYSEIQRHYHTLSHIKSLLDINQKYEKKDCLITISSILFHDIIYDPSSNRNEELSAELFNKFFQQNEQQLNITQEDKKTIIEWILATKSHLNNPSQDKDILYFLDLDLSILASESGDYQKYVKQIRQEYNIYADEQFKKGRSVFLNSWVNKKLFRSIELEHLNDYAQQNIEMELSTYQDL